MKKERNYVEITIYELALSRLLDKSVRHCYDMWCFTQSLPYLSLLSDSMLKKSR